MKKFILFKNGDFEIDGQMHNIALDPFSNIFSKYKIIEFKNSKYYFWDEENKITTKDNFDELGTIDKLKALWNIEKLKVTPPNNFSVWDSKTNTWVFDLSLKKDKALEKLEQNYQNAISANISYKSKSYQADNKSFQKIQGVLLSNIALKQNTNTYRWLDSTNKFQDLTYEDLQNILNLINKREQKAFIPFQSHKQSIRQANSKQELLNCIKEVSNDA